MGLWVNLGFVTFIILLVLSGNVRAEEKPLFTPFTVCPLEPHRLTRSQDEFVATSDTYFLPYYFQFQMFNHPTAVAQARDFMVLLTENKRAILANNQRQIRTLIGCLRATGTECASPSVKTMIERYMGNDLKKGLTLHRVFEALAFPKEFESLYVMPMIWHLPMAINYELENGAGYGLMKVRQEALTPAERAMAEDLYLEYWESFGVEVEKYLTSERERWASEGDRYREFTTNKNLGAIREARLSTDRSKLVSALALLEIPGWQETIRQRQQEFRRKMAETWFQNFNSFRVFAYIGGADPSLQQIRGALQDMYAHNEAVQQELVQTIADIQRKQTTWGGLFSLENEPKSLLEYTLARAESHCRIASNLHLLTVRGGQQKLALGGALFLGSFFLPHQLVIPLFFGAASYHAYQSSARFDSERDLFLAFMEESSAMVPGNRVLFALSEKMFGQLLLPLSVLGMPKAARNIHIFLRR